MLRGYWPLILGLISALTPFVIMNIIVWRKIDVLHSAKMDFTIFSAIVCLSFVGIVLVNAILCGL